MARSLTDVSIQDFHFSFPVSSHYIFNHIEHFRVSNQSTVACRWIIEHHRFGQAMIASNAKTSTQLRHYPARLVMRGVRL